MIKLFTKYNQCHHAAFVNFEKKQKRDFIDLAIKLGLNSSTLSIQNTYSGFEASFDRELTFRSGVETEIILPFNKDKWAILIEPTFQYFKTEVDKFYNDGTVSGKTINLTVSYSSIEFPVGIRYSSFFSNKSKLFFDVLYVVDAPLANSLYGNNGDFIDLQINSVRNNFAMGIGFEYDNKYTIEFRHATKRDVLSKYYIWHSQYQSSSLIFGYTIF